MAEPLAQRLADLLGPDDAEREWHYPGSPAGRQPVHTVYLPADRYTLGSIDAWGAEALATMQRFGPLPGFDDVLPAVEEKLRREPIEDLRIDFEDGYGVRADQEEDTHAVMAAGMLVAAVPPFSGIRMKSLEGPVRARAVRTLRLFLETLCGLGSLPEGFRVTLPKVTSVRQVQAMVMICADLEESLGQPAGSVRFEIQIETPQAILGADGTALVAPMIQAAAGRCAGLHYGTYDYSASVGIAAGWQSMEHPAADYAKSVMQVAAAGTGVPLSDGSTNLLPVGERDVVHDRWALHARLVRRSLERGFYQGWDLHPAQLPTRYAATFAFYREGLASALQRLAAYLGRADSGILDEPATARALAGYLRRGLDCGAFTEAELVERSGAAGLRLDRAALTDLG
jgi:citrate lyase beta subunit